MTSLEKKEQMTSSRALIKTYYDALNAHDPIIMTQCCAEEIEVTFPDDTRNWKSRTVAKEKFEVMFQKLENFAAEWRFEDDEDEANESDEKMCDKQVINVINVVAHFTADNYDARRKMIYTVCEGRIRRIEHLDV